MDAEPLLKENHLIETLSGLFTALTSYFLYPWDDGWSRATAISSADA